MEETLNVIYQNATMGIKGINEVLYKIQNKKLYKIIEKEKREYENILRQVKKISKKEDIVLTEINMLAKLSSDIISQMRLKQDQSDETIIQMMIDGTYTSINTLKNKENVKENKEIDKLYDEFMILLLDNIKELSNI